MSFMFLSCCCFLKVIYILHQRESIFFHFLLLIHKRNEERKVIISAFQSSTKDVSDLSTEISLGSQGRKDKKKSMTNKITVREGRARDNLCKNPLGMGVDRGKPTWILLLTTPEKHLWVYSRSWTGDKESGQGEKLLEQEELTIAGALFLDKQHFQQKC